jgi:hypothetical protein
MASAIVAAVGGPFVPTATAATPAGRRGALSLPPLLASARPLKDHLDSYPLGWNGRKVVAPIVHRSKYYRETSARGHRATAGALRRVAAENPPNLRDPIGHEPEHSRGQLSGGDSVVAADTELDQPRL